MKKFFLFMIALLTGVSGAMALTGTWGSGTFLTATSAGNASYGWFTIVSPFSGTLNSVKLNLGTGSGNSISRTDAYLAISSDLKSSTTGFSASDFVGISTNTCGTTDYEVTMTFNNTQLTGGMTYYCYFLTKSGEIYTTVGQRIYVETGKNPSLMSIGNVGSITAAQTEWAIPISCTMTLSDGLYYRMHALYPDSKCYIYSKSFLPSFATSSLVISPVRRATPSTSVTASPTMLDTTSSAI